MHVVRLGRETDQPNPKLELQAWPLAPVFGFRNPARMDVVEV
jgi:hypothetical protein